MSGTHMHNFYQCHENALLEIAGIKFTQREVDVISCIIHGRGSKKIGDLLDISPKTAEAHVRNIMMKIDCNSRERIIDFVESSQELQLVSRHYFYLLKYRVFLKQLTNISKNPCDAEVILAYDKKNSLQKTFFTELENCFQSAGITCNIIPLLELHKPSQEDSNKLILFPYSSDISGDLPSLAHGILIDGDEQEVHTGSIRCHDFRNEETSYRSFYSILKELIPHLDAVKMLKDLDIKQAKHSPELAADVTQETSEPQGNKFLTIMSKKARNLSLSAGVFIVLLSVITVTTVTFSFGDQFKSVRAEMPIPQHEFLLERHDLIQAMGSKFRKDDSNIKVLALVGIGGSGKSTLARQFAGTDRADVVWEIEAQSSASIYNSFEAFAYELAQTREEQQELEIIMELRVPSGRDKQLLSFVKKQLKKHNNWLLIYDNFSDFESTKDHFPFEEETWGTGRVIITTRNENLKNNSFLKDENIISVGQLDDQGRLNLFNKIMTGSETEDFIQKDEEFLSKIPPFPLDVSVCAYYLRNSGLSPQHYIENLQENSQQFAELQRRLSSDVSGYNKTRYGILTLSLDKLIEKNPEFKKMLLLITLINNRKIPVELLSQIENEISAENFLYNLKYYSLIIPNSSSHNRFSIHQCTQHVALPYLLRKFKLADDPELITKVAGKFYDYLRGAADSLDIGRMRALVPHAKRFLEHSDLYPLILQGEVNGQLGRIYYYLGDYDAAIVYLQKSANIFTSVYGPKHRRVAWIYTYLGKVYRNQGKYFTAMEYLEKSFRLYKKTKDTMPLKYAWISAHLGNIHRSLGNFEKGERYLRKSVEIYRKNLGDNHIKVAWASTHLANILRGVKKQDEAAELVNASYPIFRDTYGDKHPLTCWVHSCIGRILLDAGKVDEAQAILEQNLIHYRKNFGDSHVQTAWVLRGLGRLHLAKQEKEKAKNYILESLKILADNEHPDEYIALELMADATELSENPTAEDKKLALKYLRDAKQIVEENFPEHTGHEVRIVQKLNRISDWK